MRTRHLPLVAALFVMLLAWGATAQAGVPVVATGPFAAGTGYLTPVVVIEEGEKVDYTNLDAFDTHDVTSFASRAPGSASWCSGSAPCALFKSDEIGVGTTPVLGTDELPPGSYPFYCSPHAWMTGTLVVLAKPS